VGQGVPVRGVFQRGVWRYPDFKRLWLAATVSAFGTDITLTALPFVAILTLDATPWHLGLLKIVTMLPAFVVGLFAGAWLDRVPRRPVMIACDWARAGLLVTIPLAHWLFELTFAHLFIAAAGLSVASTFFEIADRSMLPSLVDREELVDANRMLTAGNTVSEASGFAVSGWLVQLVSAPGALVIDAATFVWSAITLRRIERPETVGQSDEPQEHLLRDMLEGFRFVRGHRTLMALAGSLFVMSFSIQIVGTVYLLYVSEELGFNPGVLGMIFALGGLFSLLASLSAGRLMARIGVGPLLIASLLLVAGGQSLITLATAASAFAVAMMLIQQAMDLPWSLYEITQVSVRQTVTPDEWLGRMNGSFHVLELGGYLLGAIAGAWLGDAIGLRGTLAVGAIGTALAAIPLLLSPVRGMKQIPSADTQPATA
jgi:MFS family permease